MRTSASKKLTGSVGLLVALALVVGGGALAVNYRLGDLLNEAITVKSRMRDVAGKIGQEATEMVASERGLALAMMLQQNQQADAMRSRFVRSQESFVRLTGEYSSGVRNSAGAADASSLMSSFERSRQLHDELRGLMEQQKMDLAMASLNEKLLPQLSSLNETAKKLAEFQSSQIESLAESAASTSSAGFWIVLMLNLVAFAVGAAVFWMVRRLTQTLRDTVSELSESAHELSNTSQEVGSYSMSLSKSARSGGIARRNFCLNRRDSFDDAQQCQQFQAGCVADARSSQQSRRSKSGVERDGDQYERNQHFVRQDFENHQGD